jgi:hypothetical protein
MLGEKAAKNIDILHFSNNTLSQKINFILSYVEAAVVRVKKSQY